MTMDKFAKYTNFAQSPTPPTHTHTNRVLSFHASRTGVSQQNGNVDPLIEVVGLADAFALAHAVQKMHQVPTAAPQARDECGWGGGGWRRRVAARRGAWRGVRAVGCKCEVTAGLARTPGRCSRAIRRSAAAPRAAWAQCRPMPAGCPSAPCRSR